MKSGPIILVEDDTDDKDVFEDIIRELQVPNPIIWFQECDDAFTYLKQTTEQPFIIFSDVNLPGLDGVEFKRKIDNDPDLRKKSIPFIFYSTSIDQRTVNIAYTQMTVQGFFQKKHSYDDVKDTIKCILDYWSDCRHPNAV